MRASRTLLAVALVTSVALGLSGCAVLRSVVGGPTSTATVEVRSCPSTPVPATTDGHPGGADRLIPFPPVALVVCRYGGMNSGHSQQLVAHRSVTGAAAAARLAAIIDDSGRSRWVGEHSCPADFEAITEVLTTGSGPRETTVLRADRTGCPGISNGVLRNARIDIALEHALTDAVGPVGR